MTTDNINPVAAAVADCARSATVAACRSTHHLLDWDEWRAVDPGAVPA